MIHFQKLDGNGSYPNRRAVVSGLLLCGLSIRSAGAEPDVRSFRDEIIASGRQLYPAAPPKPRGSSEIEWGEHLFDVHDTYKMIGQLPAKERAEAILGWLDMSSPSATSAMEAEIGKMTDWRFAKPLLRPVLQPAVLIERGGLISKTFSSDLRIGYVLDMGRKMLYVAQRKFTRWCVGIEDVHRAALANLDTTTDEVAIGVESEHGKPIVAMMADGAGYASSRILLPSMHDRIFQILGAPVLAAVPARESFLAWSPTSSACAENLERVHTAFDQEPHPLSDEIFLISRDGVRPARPEELGL